MTLYASAATKRIGIVRTKTQGSAIFDPFKGQKTTRDYRERLLPALRSVIAYRFRNQ